MKEEEKNVSVQIYDLLIRNGKRTQSVQSGYAAVYNICCIGQLQNQAGLKCNLFEDHFFFLVSVFLFLVHRRLLIIGSV